MALHESLPAGLDVALALNTYPQGSLLHASGHRKTYNPPLANSRPTSTHLLEDLPSSVLSEMGSRLDLYRWSVAHIRERGADREI